MGTPMGLNDASRIIDVIDGRIQRNTRSGAKVEYTWGTIASIAADGRTAGAYLYGETDGAYISEGFRFPDASYATIGDSVKVAMDYGTGDRWIEEVSPGSAYRKLIVDTARAQLHFGPGTSGTDAYIERPSYGGIRVYPDLKVARSFSVLGARGAAAGPSTNNQWAKVGHGAIGNQYGDVSFLAMVQGWGHSVADHNAAIVGFRVKQQSAFGNLPAVQVTVHSTNGFTLTDFAIVVTNYAGPTEYSFYVKSKLSYENLYFTPLLLDESFPGTSWVPDENVAWSASLPAGTVTYGTGVDNVFIGSDTNLYRGAANVLKTDDIMHAVGGLRVSSPTANDGQNWEALRIIMPNNGYTGIAIYDSPSATQPVFKWAGYGGMDFGPGGSTAIDTQFYRSAAAVLYTPGEISANTLRTRANGVQNLFIGDDASLGDVNVAHMLGVKSQTDSNQGGIQFGADANLYRSAANVLKTDDTFNANAFQYQGNTVYPALGKAEVARASSQLTLSTTITDVAGATITRNSPVAETVLVMAAMDFNTSALGTGYSTGFLDVDGVDQTGQVIGGRRSTLVRVTASQIWLVSVAAGSHTYKLQAYKTVNDGTTTVEVTHTSIVIIPLAT